MKHWARFGVTAALAWGSVVAAPPPIETFFRQYAFQNMQLSPDGQRLAVVAAHGPTNQHLLTRSVSSPQWRVACAGEILDYDWVSSNRLVITAGGPFTGGMLAVDADGGNPQLVIRSILDQALRTRRSARLYRLLARNPAQYPNVLVECAEIDMVLRRTETTVRRLNVLDGESKLVEKDPGGAVRYFPDAANRIRLVAARQKETLKLLYRPEGRRDWTLVHETEDDVYPIQLTADGRGVYVAARREEDTLGLHLFDLEARTFGACLWRHDRYDLFNVELDPQTGLQGVVCEGDQMTIDWLDPRMKARYRAMDEALPGLIKVPVATQGAVSLVFAFGDRTPGAYYLHHQTRNELELVADVAPWLDPKRLAGMKPVHYTARDGRDIQAYLTLPPGSAGTNLPMVVLPHGGPWVRDTWGFDREVQFLASRGYAVLQPNFRSSRGFGKQFEEAGYRQFGRAIQDDITDGVQWTIQQGIADPGRVAIFGTSFGGYAAMVGLTQTPDLYRCGINCAGPVDVRLILRRRARRLPKLAQQFDRLAIMDYRKDREALDEISPLKHLEAVRAPVLLAYGGQDEIVDIEQGRKLEKELKRLGKPYEMIFEEEEGHGFRKLANVLRLYGRIETFLEQHLH